MDFLMYGMNISQSNLFSRIRLCFQGLIFVDLTPLCCVMRTAKLVVQQWENARSSEVLNSAVNLVMSSW